MKRWGLLSSILILVGLVIMALMASNLSPYSLDDIDISQRLCAPTQRHWLGCDFFGGDIFTQMIWGARTVVITCFSVVIITATIGTLLGIFAGFFAGYLGMVIMRLVDLMMAFPGILLAMAISSILGPGVKTIVIAICLTGWTSYARLARSSVLSIKETDFVVSGRAIGLQTRQILFQYIFPQIWPPLIVLATFNLSGVILIEASLSFLGLGAGGRSSSWGNLLSQGRAVLIEAPHLSLVPGFAIASVVLSVNFLGDYLRDLLDTKAR